MSADAPGSSPLPPERQADLDAALGKGEAVLWVGRPRPIRFILAAVPRMLLGIPLTYLLIPWTAIAWKMLTAGQGADLQAWEELFGFLYPAGIIPVALIAGGLLFAPLFAWKNQAARTLYALTDRRALIWSRPLFGSGEIGEIEHADLEHIDAYPRSDHLGDLVLLSRPLTFEPGDGSNPVEEVRRFHFLAIPDPEAVAALAGRLRDQARGGPRESEDGEQRP